MSPAVVKAFIFGSKYDSQEDDASCSSSSSESEVEKLKSTKTKKKDDKGTYKRRASALRALSTSGSSAGSKRTKISSFRRQVVWDVEEASKAKKDRRSKKIAVSSDSDTEQSE